MRKRTINTNTIKLKTSIQLDKPKDAELIRLQSILARLSIKEYRLFHRGNNGFSSIACKNCTKQHVELEEDVDDGIISVECKKKKVLHYISNSSLDKLTYRADKDTPPTYLLCCCEDHHPDYQDPVKDSALLHSLDLYDRLYCDSLWHRVYEDIRRAAAAPFYPSNNDKHNIYQEILQSFRHLGVIYGAYLSYIPKTLEDDNVRLDGFLVKQQDYYAWSKNSSRKDKMSKEVMLMLEDEQDRQYSVARFCDQIPSFKVSLGYSIVEFGWKSTFRFKNDELNKISNQAVVLIFPIWNILSQRNKHLKGIGVLFFKNLVTSKNLINNRRFEIASENIGAVINYSRLLYQDECENKLQHVIVEEQLDTTRVKSRMSKESIQLLNCADSKLVPLVQGKIMPLDIALTELQRAIIKQLLIDYPSKKKGQASFYRPGSSELFQLIIGLNDMPVGALIYMNKLSDYLKHTIPFSSDDAVVANKITESIGWILEIVSAQDKQIEFFRIAKHEITNAEKIVENSCTQIEGRLSGDDKMLQLIQDIKHNTLMVTRFLINADIRGLKINAEIPIKGIRPFGDVIIKWLRSYRLKYRNKMMDFSIPSEMEYKDSVPLVKIKMDHFDLLIFNLLGNAFKYGARYSRVNIEVERSSDLTIRFTNYGQAWKAEETQYIFTKEYRGANAGIIDEGSGLGLFIVSTIAQAYGLEVTALDPIKLSDYNLPFAKSLLANYSAHDIGLSQEEVSNIVKDIDNLSSKDRRSIFADSISLYKRPPEKNIGTFSKLLILPIPTFKITFNLTIPKKLLI